MHPRAPQSDVFRIRIPRPLLKQIKEIAVAEKRTAAYMIRELVEQGMIRRAQLEAER